MALEYVKFDKLSLKDEFNELWLQDRIAEDPTILGLGEVILKDRERMQPRAGRLDLLLQDTESNLRYEVEVQLGRTDESHIIRTIEYWDVERKRYPQYDHVGVIVAEDVTSRFLNVISLFNGFIPLVAIQMNAVKYGNHVSLLCTTVLDQMTLGLVEDDEGELETVDRAYWTKRAPKETLAVADDLSELIKAFAPGFELKYNKFYIGLAKDGRTNNFAIFQPKRKFTVLLLKLKKSNELSAQLDEKGLDMMDYTKSGRYRLRLTREDVKANADFLKSLLQQSYGEAHG
ncbi:MAG: hypothetical protein IH624_02545 [Phycisphaerae bacterium]|nr:hypothetical protein [Phycisphaerae bacterium]